MTVLLTTHYMEEAEMLCSKIFAHFAGDFEQQQGGLRDVTRSRKTARRLG